MGKKGISFTPKKKSPSKRSVRWRDDTESGALADFEKTPQKMQSTPEVSSVEQSIVLPALPSYLAGDVSNDSLGSSPIPSAPEPSIELKPKANRFQAGFLSKKSDGSPPPPTNYRFQFLRHRPFTPSYNGCWKCSQPILSAYNGSGRPISQPTAATILHRKVRTGKSDFSDSAKIGMALKRAGSVSRCFPRSFAIRFNSNPTTPKPDCCYNDRLSSQRKYVHG